MEQPESVAELVRHQSTRAQQKHRVNRVGGGAARRVAAACAAHLAVEARARRARSRDAHEEVGQISARSRKHNSKHCNIAFNIV